MKPPSDKYTLDQDCMAQSLKDTFPTGSNAFVDLSHHNLNVNLKQAQEAGLLGFIHKVTQGIAFTDNAYAERLVEARALGLWVGAYHFCTAESVEQQISYFLQTIKKYGQEGIVPCIDWEPNPVSSEGTMTLDQLKFFIESFYQKTHIYPMLYGGYWMLYQLANKTDVAVLGKCPLWQAFYSSHFGYLSDIWSNWTLLQYTDGTLGPPPHEFAGIGKVDRNIFNGTEQQAQDFWQNHSFKKNDLYVVKRF